MEVTFNEIATAVIMIIGTFLILTTSVGLIRFPDVFCRMHAAGKAGTLGISFIILAPVVFSGTGGDVWFRGILAIIFQFLTSPAATHLMAHACYLTSYPLSDRTALDELKTTLPNNPDPSYGHE